MFNLRCRSVLACVLCTSIVIATIPQSFGKTVKADTIIKYEGENPSTDLSYRSVEEAYFSAEVKTTNKWSGHSVLEIEFKNTGTETIHDWYFTFNFNYKIENPYNCRVIESKDNLYTIGNNDWNQDIQPGKSVTVGFTAASKDGSNITDMPTFYLLNTETVTLKSGDLKYKYEEYSNWSSGFNGALILTNKTKETIRDWTIIFGANRPITQADSSVFTDNGDGTYTITNDGNNQNIAKGQSYRIGIQGGSNDPSKTFELTDFTATAKKMALKLTDDKDKNGIADVLEVDFNGIVTVTPTEAPTSTPTATSTPSATATPKATNSPTSTPTATNTPTVKPTNTTKPTATSTPTVKPTQTSTPTAKPTVTTKPTVTNTPTVKPTNTTTPTVTVTPKPTVTLTPTVSPTPDVSVTPTNTITTTPTPTPEPTGFPDDIDYEKDTDKDGLPDDLEDYCGFDKNKADSDSDGVNDYYELLLGTDPITPDSNGSNDFDNDGLTNARESELGTDPMNRDTDLDGLTDGGEVNLYGTDPKKDDTDDDGMSDYFEVYTYDCNPKVKDSNKKREQTLEFYPKTNNKLDGVVKVEIRGAITGDISENTKIKDIYGKDLHTSSIEALVGVPVDIETTGEFDEMTVRFYYEEGDYDEDNLMIMWYDEEHGEYVEWEDTVWLNDGANYVEFKTNHFSKYMLIDEKVWIETWVKAIYSVKDIELNNVGGGGFFPLGSIEAYKERMFETYGDKDVDGLPDIMETNGMIDNIGHVIYTDPNKADSDVDYLKDGIEMGQMSTMQKIFTRSYYYSNVSSPVVSGDATWEGYVYFQCKSLPDNNDSDGDGVIDDEDGKPNEKNGPINYIFIGKDEEKSTSVSSMLTPYKKAFKALGQEVIVIDIYVGSNFQNKLDALFQAADVETPPLPPVVQFKYAFRMLQRNLGDDEISNKNFYSHVEKMVILAHGWSNHIVFDPDLFAENPEAGANVTSYDLIEGIEGMEGAINPSCKINILDIQSCRCAKLQDYGYQLYGEFKVEHTCIAYKFALLPQIEKVYAWTGKCVFTNIGDGGYNSSTEGKYVVCQAENGSVSFKEVPAKYYFPLMGYPIPLYKPLQY